MKRLILVALALAVVAPLASHAQTALPRPGLCLMAPMKGASCSFTALTNGTVVYVLQGAVEFRVTSGATTTQSCVFGSGGGTGPKIAKGDKITIISLTKTTSFLSALGAANLKAWAGSGKPWPCS